MEKRKRKNSSVELKKDEEIKEESKKAPVEKSVKPVISFDGYFSGVLKENPKIQPHHKAPMRAFAEKHNMLSGTLEQFKKVFSLY